jgi:hypothetical protein
VSTFRNTAGVPDTDCGVRTNFQNEPEAEGEGNGRGAQPIPPPVPAVPDTRQAARPRVDVPPIPGPSNDTVQPHPPPTVNDEHRRPQPLARLPRRTLRPGPSDSSTSRDARATSPHFSTPGATMVAPMRLSPTRAPTEPLADEPPEPGSDWYFGHDDIDASFLSRAASELERSEALLSQSSQPTSQQSIPPNQRQHEIIVVGEEDDDKENASLAPRAMGRPLERQYGIGGSVIDLSEIIEGARIQRPKNDDVISIGSDD